MFPVDTITEGAPLIAQAILHKDLQGSVTFLYGSDAIYAERAQRRGEALDPMASDEALKLLSESFLAAGWLAYPARDPEDNELISVIFRKED